jgi:hypothetical protein
VDVDYQNTLRPTVLDLTACSVTYTNMMLLAFPQGIWEMILDLLPEQDLQSISKVGSPISFPDTGSVRYALATLYHF